MKNRIKENTWQTKEHIIRTKILPYFGKRKISDIQPRDVIAWQNEMIKGCNKNGKKYSTMYQVFITTKSVDGLILRDLDLFKSFKTKPVILLGLSHIWETNKGAAHNNINIAHQIQEAGIPVRVFITPILPYIMNVEEMITAISQDIPIYLDKLRVFEKGNQNVKMYEWVKKHYPMYAENYSKILFKSDEKYYFDLVQKYQSNSRITFMSELWNEN